MVADAPVDIGRANEELARSAVWRLLAQAFADPVGGSTADLVSEDLPFALALIGSLPAPVAEALAAADAAFAGAEVVALDDDYRAVFSHVHSADCPPFETDHTARQVWRQSQELADLAGFYRAFGVEQLRERPDHVSVELEFLHLLTYKSAWATVHGDGPHAEMCADAYEAFLRDHAARWLPGFADRLLVLARGRPLAAAARLLHAMLVSEAVRTGIVLGVHARSDADARDVDGPGLCEVEP